MPQQLAARKTGHDLVLPLADPELVQREIHASKMQPPISCRADVDSLTAATSFESPVGEIGSHGGYT